MKRTLKIATVLMVIAFATVSLTGCGVTVPAGEVGIKVNQWGTNRGVDDYPLQTGRVLFNPITTDVFTYPVHRINRVWTKDSNEGSPNDDSVTFNSVEGAVVNADIFASLTMEREKIPAIYVEFREQASAIMDVFVRSEIRDAISRAASTMLIADIMGQGKADLERRVIEDLQSRLGPKGIEIHAVSFVGALRVGQDVQDAIHAVIVAKNKAIEAQNKIVQSTAEAQQKIATARGDSLSAIIAARGVAEANRLLNASLTPAMVQWQALKVWNGQLPQVTGGAVPFVSIGNMSTSTTGKSTGPVSMATTPLTPMEPVTTVAANTETSTEEPQTTEQPKRRGLFGKRK